MSKDEYTEIIIDKINNLKDNINEKLQSKLELDLFEEIVIIVDEYRDECSVCQKYYENLKLILAIIEGYINKNSEEELKKYQKELNDIVKHLKQEHNLKKKGYYLELGISLGISFGLMFGVLMDILPIGMLFGLFIGIVIGTHFDSIAKKEGRII